MAAAATACGGRDTGGESTSTTVTSNATSIGASGSASTASSGSGCAPGETPCVEENCNVRPTGNVVVCLGPGEVCPFDEPPCLVDTLVDAAIDQDAADDGGCGAGETLCFDCNGRPLCAAVCPMTGCPRAVDGGDAEGSDAEAITTDGAVCAPGQNVCPVGCSNETACSSSACLLLPCPPPPPW
jgi:hypothetical protein